MKDMTRLGRNIENVIIVDNSPASYLFQPENAIPCESFIENPSDRELLEMVPFLESIATVPVSGCCVTVVRPSCPWPPHALAAGTTALCWSLYLIDLAPPCVNACPVNRTCGTCCISGAAPAPAPSSDQAPSHRLATALTPSPTRTERAGCVPAVVAAWWCDCRIYNTLHD